MYFTTNGAYRKSKMTIDFLNMILTIVIAMLFCGIVFLRGNSGVLFPAIFVAGALMNALTSAKSCMNYNKLAGVVLAFVAIGLFVLAIFSWQVVSRTLS